MSPYSVVGSCPAFSPLPEKKKKNSGGYFLLHCLKITPHCAFRRRVPFPVRTFLRAYGSATNRPAILGAKLQTIFDLLNGSLDCRVFVAAG